MPQRTIDQASVTYFIQSRPAPSAPWQKPDLRATWASKNKALEQLAMRRERQPNWEHRLMQRTITVTDEPVPENPHERPQRRR
ncbi:hypothetical protein [Streptomyces murinus]